MNFMFLFFNVATRKFKILSVAPTVFLLERAGLSRAFCNVVYGCEWSFRPTKTSPALDYGGWNPILAAPFLKDLETLQILSVLGGYKLLTVICSLIRMSSEIFSLLWKAGLAWRSGVGGRQQGAGSMRTVSRSEWERVPAQVGEGDAEEGDGGIHLQTLPSQLCVFIPFALLTMAS